MNFLDLIWLIPLFPAAGFVINGLFGKFINCFSSIRRIVRTR